MYIMANKRSLPPIKSFTPSPKLISITASPQLSRRTTKSMTALQPKCMFPFLVDASPKSRALHLPRTPGPSVKHQPLRKRFSDMAETIERIPSEDWLSSLLYAKPEFTMALTKNIEKCKMRLAQHQLVREAINEEDNDCSEVPSRAVSRLR